MERKGSEYGVRVGSTEKKTYEQRFKWMIDSYGEKS
jgi:hypothetical protein